MSRVVRGRTRLYYTKGTDEGTRRPRGLPLMMLYSRLPRSLSYLLAASRCLLDILAHRTRISSEEPTLLSAPLRRTSGWRSGVPGGEEIGAIVKWSIITDSLRASLLLALHVLLFLIHHIVIAIKINSCSCVTG